MTSLQSFLKRDSGTKFWGTFWEHTEDHIDTRGLLFLNRCTTRCHSFSLVVILCHLLSFIVPLVATCYSLLYQSLSLVAIRCNSLHNSLAFAVTCLFFFKQSDKTLVKEFFFTKDADCTITEKGLHQMFFTVKIVKYFRKALFQNNKILFFRPLWNFSSVLKAIASFLQLLFRWCPSTDLSK